MKTAIFFIFTVLFLNAQSKIYKGKIDDRDFTIVFNQHSEKSDTISANTFYYFDDDNAYNEIPVHIVLGKKGQKKTQFENDNFKMSGTISKEKFHGKYVLNGKPRKFCLQEYKQFQFEEFQNKEQYSITIDPTEIEVFDFYNSIIIFKNKNEQSTVLKAAFPTNYQFNNSVTELQLAIYRESLNEVLKDLDTAMIREDYFNPYQMYETFQPIRIDDKYVVFSNDIYFYWGGAHGIGNQSFVNFNISNHKVISFEDVFSENQLPALEELLQKKVREKYGIAADVSLQNAEFEDNCFIVDDIEITKNFYIGKQGITFVYNPYEMTAYACGNFSLTLDWNDVNGITNFKY